MGKLIYVTKKQVNEYIDTMTSRDEMSYRELLDEVEWIINDLDEFRNDNPNQLKFYGRVRDELKRRF